MNSANKELNWIEYIIDSIQINEASFTRYCKMDNNEYTMYQSSNRSSVPFFLDLTPSPD